MILLEATHFENEVLWPGYLGHVAVITVFIFSIFAALSYFIATRKKDVTEYKQWLSIARVFYFIQAVSVIIIFISLYYIISRHRFEYRYAWEHSNLQLQTKYLLSCFWEGQEGSFLLWMFWNALLGAALVFTSKDWEPYVMTSFTIVQAFLASMLLGIYVFGYQVGSTPFILMRDYMVNAPIFQRADYLHFIKDGNGLNPLLQNYWMVIHPPTLFLGFASTLVPFSYAIAALWRKNFTGLTGPVLPWALFSGAVLGTGIMMGAAWAYESLTFGGYWAWGPVENASLVPWIVLIAGIHTLLAYKKTGHSLKTTIAFFLLSFILVLYSTFLTRSGILGKTSVHAFTDLGMLRQLVVYMAALSIPAIFLFFYRWKAMPEVATEEHIFSREFWIFIGSLMLFLSSLQIILTTSIPVYNAILGTNWAPPTEIVQHYNKWQIPFAIVIAILASGSLFLKFKKSEVKYFGRRLLITTILSLLVTALLVYETKIYYFTYATLLFAGIFSMISSAYYFVSVLSGKWKVSGPAIAHFGFGMVLVGILYSSYKQQVISSNTMGIDFGKDFDDKAKRENMLLYKDIPSQLANYRVTYIGDSVAPPNYYYKVLYERMDSATGKVEERFVLKPNAQINPKMGLIASPDTRHYLTHDIYTHVTSVPDKSLSNEVTADKYKPHDVKVGDTIFTTKYYVLVKKIEKVDKDPRVNLTGDDIAVKAEVLINDLDGFSRTADPLFYVHNHEMQPIASEQKDIGISVKLSNIKPDKGVVTLEVAESKPEPDYIVMKAIMFPDINLLWLGTLISISGFVISIIKILTKKKKLN